MPEGSGALWRYIQKMMPPGAHATRIESRCSPGFPDVHYNWAGVTGTLELKSLRKKNLPFGNDGLNLEQRIWHREAIANGAHALIIAEVHNEIFFMSGKWYNRFNESQSLGWMSSLIVVKRKLGEADIRQFHLMLQRINV